MGTERCCYFFILRKKPIASHVRFIAFMCKDKVAEACLSVQEPPYVIPIRTGLNCMSLERSDRGEMYGVKLVPKFLKCAEVEDKCEEKFVHFYVKICAC